MSSIQNVTCRNIRLGAAQSGKRVSVTASAGGQIGVVNGNDNLVLVAESPKNFAALRDGTMPDAEGPYPGNRELVSEGVVKRQPKGLQVHLPSSIH